MAEELDKLARDVDELARQVETLPKGLGWREFLPVVSVIATVAVGIYSATLWTAPLL